MKYFIISGEPSGDLHGSNLIRGILAADPKAQIFCWGGELMETAGGTLLMHYRKLAFMGFVAILLNIRTIAKNMHLCKQQISEHNPDVVILIDYPGFNLRIAKFVKGLGIKVYYYISPKIWAWQESRIKKIKRNVDRMYIIFPFEVDFYRKHNVEVEYHGNPLVDEIERKKTGFETQADLRKSLGIDDRPVIALLAGSRSHEIKHILPEMLKAVKYFPEYQFVLAGVRNLPESLYRKIIGNSPVNLLTDKTYETLCVAEAALVTSGTATLETALMGVPQVVCYKADFFSMLIASMVIKVKFISLVNLIMESEVIKELIQYDLTEKKLLIELKHIVQGGAEREMMLKHYDSLKKKLGTAGASARIASDMVNSLK
ncbi:MAG: lipid-A-disaccharide synthase [Odoribacter sp.]|nr:lipid-A-disaccharide synthase [Odoribacter sp.]